MLVKPAATHNSATPSLSQPSLWVRRFAPLVRPRGPVLDLACGGGRHVRFFHDRGHKVTGVDLDHRGLRDLDALDGVEIVQADLEDGPWPFEGQHFAGIVVTNYLHRPLFPKILAALEPCGVLIYETFAVGNHHFGRPSHPSFLLESGELIELVQGKLQIAAYEHGEVAEPRPAILQRIAAINNLTEDCDADGNPRPPALPV